MNDRMYSRLINLSMVFVLSGAACAGAQAASPAAPAEINMNDLNILEHRFFSHPYAHDPAEKRLERLECLVFGSTREGNNTERMARLMKTVATRSQQPIAQEKGPSTVTAAPDAPQATAKVPAGSKQYPILTTLEWKALKKTFPNESLDQRLDRLESKMFGQPAETMAYADRVERLKKTVGIGLDEVQDGIAAVGPMPKASPRSGNMVSPLEGMMPQMMMNPFMNTPFGDTAFGGMQQMLQKMAEMQQGQGQGQSPTQGQTQFYSHSMTFDPKTNQWIEQENGAKPKILRLVPPSATTPGIIQSETHLKEAPGYTDPNSI